MRSLARSLSDLAGEPSADRFLAALTGDPSGLADCVEMIRARCGARSSSVLVTIDQGEELLTLTGENEREQFLWLLTIFNGWGYGLG